MNDWYRRHDEVYEATAAVIPASDGAPYLIGWSGPLLKLQRTFGKRPTFMLMAVDDALAVADALVDAVEQGRPEGRE